MINPESSPLWYRVANLKARLRDHVLIHRHHYRGKLWYVLQDQASHRYYRFDSRTYQLIRQLDGQFSLQDIWEHKLTPLFGDKPTQDEIIKLLVSLHNSDLIQCDITPDTRELLTRNENAQSAKWKTYVKGPLLIRIPLCDPDAILSRLNVVTSSLFNRTGFFALLSVVMLSCVIASSHWSDITNYWSSRALAPYNLLLFILTYPVIKGLHELAHALAVKRWGGEVHEMGVMLLLFMPLPYVDASSSSAFRNKHKRMLVGSAGIVTELFLAAIATLVWLSVETGTLRDIAYNVMLIGGISSVLFNGNPLLRFDGYYVLSDAIEIPNLAQRSSRFYGYLIQRYLFGINDVRNPAHTPGERPWFVFYGLTSTLYRLLILVTIVMFLAEKYLLIGVLLGIFAVFIQIVSPVVRQIQFVLRSPTLDNRRLRALGTIIGIVCAVFAFIVYVPLPSSTYTQGIIWLPEHAQVRANTDGFIAQVLAKPQTKVSEGMPLFQTFDPLLEVEVQQLEWELRALGARFNERMLDDRVEATILEGQIEQVSLDLAQARDKITELTVVSQANGTFFVPGAQHLNGRFTRKGDVLGYVTDLSTPTIRAVVRQSDISLVRENTETVKIQLADFPGQTINATIQHQVPSATAKLPSQSLGTLGGGIITVDPTDPDGVNSMEDVFLVDIVLLTDVNIDRVGTRVHIRFEHKDEPLATRFHRMIRQLLLSRFTV